MDREIKKLSQGSQNMSRHTSRWSHC